MPSHSRITLLRISTYFLLLSLLLSCSPRAPIPAVFTATPLPPATEIPPTETQTPLPTNTSTPQANVVLVGAGDISSCSQDNDDATAKLLDDIDGTVFTTGDHAYPDGTESEYVDCYEPTWGRHKSRTKPVPGNHDYYTEGATGYFEYFGVPEYYAYALGSWRIYALNSEIDVSATSPQVAWLQNDLAEHPSLCVLAYWHRPRWSSGSDHGNDDQMQPMWEILYNADAELVINGHEHIYERFAEMDASGAAVPQGLREIIVGTGGGGLDKFGTIGPSSENHSGSTYGVLKLTLYEDSYDWQFIPIVGGSFTDRGSSACH